MIGVSCRLIERALEDEIWQIIEDIADDHHIDKQYIRRLSECDSNIFYTNVGEVVIGSTLLETYAMSWNISNYEIITMIDNFVRDCNANVIVLGRVTYNSQNNDYPIEMEIFTANLDLRK